LNKVIIVATCKKYRPWLKSFLESYDSKYPLLVVNNDYGTNQYDARALIEGIKGNYDEFLVLHDTMLIKDNTLFDIVFEGYSGKSVCMIPENTMFMFKYCKKDIEGLSPDVIKDLFSVTSKWEAVLQERKFSDAYKAICNPMMLFPGLDKGNNNPKEYYMGRDNMVIENKYFKKFKGSWDMLTLEAADDYIPKSD